MKTKHILLCVTSLKLFGLLKICFVIFTLLSAVVALCALFDDLMVAAEVDLARPVDGDT